MGKHVHIVHSKPRKVLCTFGVYFLSNRQAQTKMYLIEHFDLCLSIFHIYVLMSKMKSNNKLPDETYNLVNNYFLE